jgi:hypothetical protein
MIGSLDEGSRKKKRANKPKPLTKRPLICQGMLGSWIIIKLVNLVQF